MTEKEWKQIVRKIFKLVEQDFLPVSFNGWVVREVDKEKFTMHTQQHWMDYDFVEDKSSKSIKEKFKVNVPVFK